jgi:hypothetical protein
LHGILPFLDVPVREEARQLVVTYGIEKTHAY